MKLLEYEAKQILKDCGVAVPRGQVVDETLVPELPTVLKVQVPVGGRGKAGGIKVIETANQYLPTLKQLRRLRVQDFTPSCIYGEAQLAIEREIYLAILINRETSAIEIVAHPDGGVEIEDHIAGSFYRQPVNSQNIEAASQALADFLGLNQQAFLLSDMVRALYNCFIKNDATLLEINPLVLTKNARLIAADCKMELDDMASFRHPEWSFEQIVADVNFVNLNPNGQVATIANGAGLAMATVDAVVAKNLLPANFLDIGGGATTEKVVASFRQIMQIKSVQAIVINIFGGIVQCDTVARAIIEAKNSIDNLPALYIRLSGTNADIAADLLRQQNIQLYANLEDCLEAIEV